MFKKGRTTSDVLFIDASKGFTKEKAKNKLRDEDVEKIVDTYKKFANSENAETEKYSHVASIDEIKGNEYNLNIPRYAGNQSCET